jgi:hypothetical protein
LQPQFIGKSKIATQVFGELMNGFVEPLTLKAMVKEKKKGKIIDELSAFFL